MKQSIKQQAWKENDYKNNKEKHRLKQQQRRKEIKAYVESLKESCIICGDNEKCYIDFHHKNSDEKDFTIADAGMHKWSNKKIFEEVSKCVSICSNHHRQLHYYDLTLYDLKIIYDKKINEM